MEGVSCVSENFMGKFECLGIVFIFVEGGLFGLVNKIFDIGYELGEVFIKMGLFM